MTTFTPKTAMVRPRSRQDMRVEAISRSRFFVFHALDPSKRICSACSGCSASLGLHGRKRSGYGRSTLRASYLSIGVSRYGLQPGQVSCQKSATSATSATRHADRPGRRNGAAIDSARAFSEAMMNEYRNLERMNVGD